MKMYRDIDSIPVLAPAGAIVPMYKNDSTNDLSLSQSLEINVWSGNGRFELYEDDGESKDYKTGKYVITKFDLTENNGKLSLTITPPADNKGLIPEEREVYIKFRDIEQDEIRVILSNEPTTIEVDNARLTKNESKDELKSQILTRVQGSNVKKTMRFNKKLPGYVHNALSEIEALIY